MSNSSVHTATLRDLQVGDLSYALFLQHAPAGATDIAPKQLALLHILDAQINAVTVEASAGLHGTQPVAIVQDQNTIQLSCSCKHDKKHWCMHQAVAFYGLLEQRELRLFFVPSERQLHLVAKSKAFGSFTEEHVESHFELVLDEGAPKVIPLQRSLLTADDFQNDRFKQQLLPTVFDPEQQLNEKEFTFVLIQTSRMKRELTFKWCAGLSTAAGLPKAPITLENALDEVAHEENLARIKSFVALGILQQEYRFAEGNPIHNESLFDKEIQTVKQLRPLLSVTPLFELIDRNQRIKASNFQSVSLDFSTIELQLKVQQDREFYVIEGQALIEQQLHDIQTLVLDYHYFIRLGKKLVLIQNWHYFRVLSYLKAHHGKVVIHQTQFEQFQQEIITPLQEVLTVNYALNQPAKTTSRKQTQLTQIEERAVYFSQSEHFVHITPVVRYGDVDVPVLSKRKPLTLDASGKLFEITRSELVEQGLLEKILPLHPDFMEQLNRPFFYLHKKELIKDDWFIRANEALKAAEITVYGFKEISPVLLSDEPLAINIQLISGLDWFDVHLVAKHKNKRIGLQQIQKAIVQRKRFVSVGNGEHALLPEEWIARLEQFFYESDLVEHVLRFSKTKAPLLDEWFEKHEIDTEAQREIKRIGALLKSQSGVQTIRLSSNFKGQLRSYQQKGFDWLYHLHRGGLGGVLADDMGLGKTIQVLAFLQQLWDQHKGHYFIVAPNSLLFNWENEIERFTNIPVITYHGAKRTTNRKLKKGIVLTTYGTLLNDVHHFETEVMDVIVVDEAQFLKNPQSERYKALMKLQGKTKIALSGTPVENTTIDLFALLNFCNPGMLGNLKHFKDHYAFPIDKFQDSKRQRELKALIQPFILRRTKSEVAKDLPAKTEIVVRCELHPKQRQTYDVYKNQLRSQLLTHPDWTDGEQRLHVLQALMKLRQICNSPATLNEQDGDFGQDSAKVDELMRQLTQLVPQHKVLVFSQFVSMINYTHGRLEEEGIQALVLTGETKNRKSVIEQFQNDPSVGVLLLSLKVGGTGLNLTAADYVFLLDPWWNPAVEQQAIDRTHRIGQTRKVIAVRTISPDTIEEKILVLQERKRELAAEMIATDEEWFTRLDNSELMNLLT